MKLFIFFLLLILALNFKFYLFSQEIFSSEKSPSDKYDHHGRRDPFIPLVDEDGNLLPEVRPVGFTVEPILEGILWDDKGESYAIISGTVLRAGDLLGDYKVVKIGPRRVILSRGGEEITINLSTEEE